MPNLDELKVRVSKVRLSVENLFNGNDVNYRLHVVTGDRRGAGTDANVYVMIHDHTGKASSIIKPNSIFRDDHERGSTTSVDIPDEDGICHPFTAIEVWRDNFGNLPSFLGKISEYLFGGKNKNGSAAWYLDRIEIEDTSNQYKWVFPVQRWIAANKHYYIRLYDSILPQHDERHGNRLQELTLKRKEYKYKAKYPRGPAQVVSFSVFSY